MSRSLALLWFVNEVIDEKKDVLLVVELDLFTISTITLPKLEILATMMIDAKIDIVVKISTNAKIGTNPKIGTHTKISINMKISIDKLIFYFPHTLGEILIDIMPTKIKL